ncbi:MAG: DUF4349 domain-containing protein [Defluviitaleaceae bacterium]|nr:DUF4349 domain-containing protein [Defluviitaleaceae bacterium]
MKKLMIFVLGLILVLGLSACARSFDEAPAHANMMTNESLRVSHSYGVQNFELPLTGGGGWSLFSRSRQTTSAPQTPPIAPDAIMAPLSEDDSPALATYEDLEWDDIAGTGERHIIQTAHVEMDTEYFDEIVVELRQLAPSVNGFVESSMVTGHGRRMFTIVMRVPVATFDMVLRHVENMAYVRFSNQWAQDVTDQFYDMVGSYRIRRLEEERILALIAEAETVQELLALEQRLSNTRLSIEMYLSQLNIMAGQIAYSTITVTLYDVSETPMVVTGPSLGERIGGAFGDSVDGTVRVVQGAVIFLAAAIVPLALVGLVVGVVYLIVRLRTRKKESPVTEV